MSETQRQHLLEISIALDLTTGRSLVRISMDGCDHIDDAAKSRIKAAAQHQISTLSRAVAEAAGLGPVGPGILHDRDRDGRSERRS